MYLEISGRRTGKTTRLIDAVFEHIFNGGTAIIYTLSKEWGNSLYREYFNHPRFDDKVLINPMYTSIELLNTKVFYDEFDMCEGVRIYKNGYYSTTPYKMRDINAETRDTFLKLLDLQFGSYVSYINKDIVYDMSKTLCEEVFNLEALAKFKK